MSNTPLLARLARLAPLGLFGPLVLLLLLGPGLARVGFAADRSEAAEPADATVQADASAAGASVEDLREALSDPDPYARARRLGVLVPTVSAEVAPSLVVLISDPTLKIGGVEAELLTRAWAAHQPAEAASWALLKSPAAYRLICVSLAVEAWAEADPVAAGARVGTPDGNPAFVARAAQSAVIRGWLHSGQPGLEQYIRAMGHGVARQQALADFVRETIRSRGSDAIIEWAEAVPDEPEKFKLEVYRQVASGLARLDLDAAFRWCDAHCDGPFGSNARKLIASQWAEMDGGAVPALEWLSQLPEGEERDFAVRVTFAVWSRRDQAAAFAWLSGHGRDEMPKWLVPAVPIYAKMLSATSPQEAIEWAALIPNEEEQRILMVRFARRWLAADPEAAEAWLQQSPLSEEERQEARSPDPNGII